MRNILTDCPAATPRAWITPAATAGTPATLGYMALTGASNSLNATTHVLTLQLADSRQYANLQAGDTFTLDTAADSDLVGVTLTVATVNTSTGVVTCLVSEVKTVLTTSPTYLIANLRFRNLTALPYSARGTPNGGVVYLGPRSSAGDNWFAVDPSYTSGVQYSAVLGSCLTLAQLYFETTSTGDRLYLLFH